VTDEPEKYEARTGLPQEVAVEHRDELDRIQKEFRDTRGTTAIIYDQTCATEKRRRRKRGKMADVEKRVLINELVCEGCGDCSVQSNCVAVEPLETPFGRKRQINQNSCNKDYSCTKGFCPSFVTVEGGRLRKPDKALGPSIDGLPAVPHPQVPVPDTAWGIVVAGVGGTGVITIGQLLGMAAHIDGKAVITQDAAGLAQKGGATWSHVQIAQNAQDIFTTKVDTAKADLIIGCDAIVAANKVSLSTMHPQRTFVALNTHHTPTAEFVNNTEWAFPAHACEAAIAQAVGKDQFFGFDAERVATQALGDAIYTNPLLLGFAWQKGCIPLSEAALMKAMELNGVQIANNQKAFAWGRQCANDLASVQALFTASQTIAFVKRPSLEEIVRQRMDFLTAYQDANYAGQYQSFVERVRSAETALGGGWALSEAVARYLFKVMAYKDEYEVARLHTDTRFTERIASKFEGDYVIKHHLAPPMVSRRNENGELQKSVYGPWVRSVFALLARLKVVRGTALDVFGYTEERKQERALIGEYREAIAGMLTGLTRENREAAAEFARLPEVIRGYGHVKARHLAAVRTQWPVLLSGFHRQ